jgi:hypothetical protein
MDMDDFRRLAQKMDQHVQQLFAQGITKDADLFHRMMGYMPDLKIIWDGTTDRQLVELSNEYPQFFRFAYLVEQAFEQERQKPTRPYDGLPMMSEQHKHMMNALLTTAATLERGYQAYINAGLLPVFRPQVIALDQMRDRWMDEVEILHASLANAGVGQDVLAYVQGATGMLHERIAELAKKSAS